MYAKKSQNHSLQDNSPCKYQEHAHFIIVIVFWSIISVQIFMHQRRSYVLTKTEYKYFVPLRFGNEFKRKRLNIVIPRNISIIS